MYEIACCNLMPNIGQHSPAGWVHWILQGSYSTVSPYGSKKEQDLWAVKIPVTQGIRKGCVFLKAPTSILGRHLSSLQQQSKMRTSGLNAGTTEKRQPSHNPSQSTWSCPYNESSTISSTHWSSCSRPLLRFSPLVRLLLSPTHSSQISNSITHFHRLLYLGGTSVCTASAAPQSSPGPGWSDCARIHPLKTNFLFTRGQENFSNAHKRHHPG